MGNGWYYLDEQNRVCGPIELGSPEWKAINYDPRDHEVHPHVKDSRRPCTWARVAYTELAETCYVSTVFMSLDHNYYDGPPLVFESMAFWGLQGPAGPPSDELRTSNPELYDAALGLYELVKDKGPFPTEWDSDRYSTWDQAERGHARLVAKLRKALDEARAALWTETLTHLRQGDSNA